MTLKKAWPTTLEAVSFTFRRHCFILQRSEDKQLVSTRYANAAELSRLSSCRFKIQEVYASHTHTGCALK